MRRREEMAPVLAIAALLAAGAPGAADAFSVSRSSVVRRGAAASRGCRRPRSPFEDELSLSRRPYPSAPLGGAVGPSRRGDDNSGLKSDLLKRIETLRAIKERDGDIPVDFGVKGGELDERSRAPQKVDYYTISKDAGEAADAIIEAANELAKVNPTDDATRHLGDRERGDESPLNGTWKLLFTTAADATFSKDSKRGDARARNVVDAKRGRITNVVDFRPLRDGDDGTERPPLLEQLNVVIGASAVGKSRVELRFRYAKVVFSKLFGWRRRFSLYIPVPAPFITRVIVFLSRIVKFGRNKERRAPPKAYFDVLYLDDQLRIHRTGEDNLFIQAKESAWEAAEPLLV